MDPSLPKPLSLAAIERIDSICLRYEDCWLQGASPSLEEFVEDAEASDREALVYELLRIDLAYGGIKRELLSESAYARRLPAYRDVIHAVFTRRPPAAIRPLAPGQRIGRYTVERELGRGGFGAVFLADDDQLDRQVAIKTLRPDLAATAESKRMLMEEARLAAKLDHEGIASLYDIKEDSQQRPYLVYQYIAGDSLRQKMNLGQLEPQQMAEIVYQLADAADYAHRQGVIHRDLQPNNVLLQEDKPIITDFGLATHHFLRPPQHGEVVGSPPYLAPEQTRGDAKQTDARVDIWALGVILYEGLTGIRPFDGENLEEIIHDINTLAPTPPRQLDAAIPQQLEAICLCCLQKSPHDRYATAADLRRALGEFLHPSLGRRGSLLVLLTIALLSTTLLTWYVYSGQDASEPWMASADVLVMRDGFWAKVGSTKSPSVGPGDSVRFELSLNREAFVYVVWIDGDGNATPIYPWIEGQWDERAPAASLRQLGLPSGADAFWEMQVEKSCSESVIVLARETPLSRSTDIRQLFDGLPSQPSIKGDGVVHFHNGQIDVRGARDRSPDFKTVGVSEHGVLLTHRLLHERLSDHFPLVRGLSFSTRVVEPGRGVAP